MDASADRPHHRHGVSLAVLVVLVAWLDRPRIAQPALADFRTRRAAGRRWLVDGCLWLGRPRRSLAISSRHPSGAGVPDLCRADLDCTTLGQAAVGANAAARADSLWRHSTSRAGP